MSDVTIKLDSSPRAKEQEGAMIGPYKLLQEIGEDGFGTVWMAEQQQPVRRRVALKIIKAGMDTKEVVARFEQERQALAMMDHPNIAQVFDAGSTESGRLYFVMELVKGIPVTRFCDEQKLGTRERLALFADVCSAINHAHQKGIIHRDIKPSNVMVTLHGDKAVPKVIDFGIAKATQTSLTDKTLFTRFEQFVGTPVYMSPEQAALSGLDIDTRSDIYALGILLYELVTGRPPFDAQSLISAGYDEMRRIIREVDPPKPSSRLSTVVGNERTALALARHISPDKISRLVEPDLDWIVMKAIEKDRTRRYETANAFALDIQRFLSDEPVSASPPGAGYLLRKFARRHKAALRVAAIIALLMVAGTVTSTLLAIRAMRAEKEAARQLAEKELALDDAEEIVHFLTGILESPDPKYQNRDITVAASLDRAALVIETSLARQPARQMKIKAALGRAYAALGRADKAIPLQEKVRDYYASHAGPGTANYINAVAALAWTYDYLTRREEAIPLQREVLRWHEAHRPGHPDTSQAMGTLGRTLWFAGHQAEGMKLQEKALAMSQTNPGPEDPQTILLMHWLAVALADEGNPASEARARQLNEEQLRLSTKVLGEKHPETIRAMSAVAARIPDAKARLAQQRRVVELSAEVNGPEHPYTLAAIAFVARSLREAKEPKLALEMYEDLLPRMIKTNTLEHADTLWVMASLATSLEEADPPRAEQALKMRHEVVRISEQFLGAEHYDTLGAKAKLAHSQFDAKSYDEARWQREQILPLLIKVRGADHETTDWVRRDLARDYLRVDRHANAIPLLEETLRIRRAAVPESKTKTRETMQTLARAYSKAARPDDARRLEEELGIAPAKLAPGAVIVPAGAKWKWLHPADGRDPAVGIPEFHEQFFLPAFDDRAWTESAAHGEGFGYRDGDIFAGVDIGTPAKGTAYFRHAFKTDQTLTHLRFFCQRDDGVIVYLDGTEVQRDNVGTMPEAWQLSAQEAASAEEGESLRGFTLPGDLAAGPHLLAISLHNISGESSDLRLGSMMLVDANE